MTKEVTIKELLEKGKALALEKDKAYIILVPEDFYWGDSTFPLFEKEEEVPPVVILLCPDPQAVRLFELEKEQRPSEDKPSTVGLCSCCRLPWVECFCPTHTGECNSQWKEKS